MTDNVKSAPEAEQTNREKDPEEWVTGDETMTGSQASYLKTLCEEAGEAFDDTLTRPRRRSASRSCRPRPAAASITETPRPRSRALAPKADRSYLAAHHLPLFRHGMERRVAPGFQDGVPRLRRAH